MMKRLLFGLAVCLCFLNVTYVFGQDDETSTTTQSTTTNATVSKSSRKVNWTEVELKWNEVLDDDIVHEKWKKLDENLKSGKVNSIASEMQSIGYITYRYRFAIYIDRSI